MAKIDIDGTSFYYEYQGRGDPLVLVAGYSCDHTFWDAIYDELTKHFQVLIFDNRGIGQTKDLLSPLTLELMADDTIKLIRALNLKHPIVLGQSMGGAIAQIIARKVTDEISKLIILNSSAQINKRTLMMLGSLLNIFKEKISFDTMIEASMPWFFSADYLSDPKNIASYKEICINNSFPPTAEILQRQLNALMQFNAQAWISELKVPTFVIASDDDIVCLPSESKQLANGIANARFISITGGHSSPVENPTQVVSALLKIKEM